MAMALVSLSTILTPPSSSSSSFSSPKPSSSSIVRFRPLTPLPRFRRHLVRMAPDEEKMTRRSPLDFPIVESVHNLVDLTVSSDFGDVRSYEIEWERPKPGRRPDIFPQFSPMKTPLPPPLPADPPEEDEEEEEKKEEEEEPEKEEPDKPDKPEKQ
ncbi:hypothetical protein JHK82_021941 [Glycine max]|nr:hypothetical protein JHK85_022409 [Glycine max]KAG5137210.1 hypothetical protein JHK82_021941 [Glycine max]